VQAEAKVVNLGTSFSITHLGWVAFADQPSATFP